VLIFGKVWLVVSFSIGSVSSRLLLLRRPFVSLGQCLVPSHDRAHAAVSHFSRARRNARQVPAPSSKLRICIQVPQTLQTFDHGEPPLPLCDASATGSTVQCQHEQDIVDPPSIIKLFQEHPSDIPPVDTVEAIRMQEAVALLIRPGMHVVALTQNHPGEHG